MRVIQFRQIAEFYAELPRNLSAELRRVVEAQSERDIFSSCFALFEALILHLDCLCNSVYLDRPVDRVDEALDAYLRGTPQVLAFGHKVGGLRTFGRIKIDLDEKLPALARIVSGKELPATCVRALKSFTTIREARERFEVPPSKLGSYLDARLPGDDKGLGRASIHDFFSEMVTFRNRGIGHTAEESWFPQDRTFFALLNELLVPAIDALLAWEPMRAVLTAYEVVQIGAIDAARGAGDRERLIERPNVLDGMQPLGPSRLILQAGQPAEGAYVARRTGDRNVLEALVRCHPYPRTLQSYERLYQRYRREYLMAYLDRGVITPSQRQDELQAMASKFSIPVEKLQPLERELQNRVDDYSGSEDDAIRETAVKELQRLLGAEWPAVQERVRTLLEQLPTRRKDYIYQTIEDSVVTSFAQLKAESELSEPDLEAVLEELEEQDRKIRRVGGAGPFGARSQAHFKVHDQQKPHSFKALLDRFRETATGRRKHPELVWRLVTLCHSLLIDDGFQLPRAEIDAYRESFQVDTPARAAAGSADGPDDASVLILRVNDREIRAASVRQLLDEMWQELRDQHIDASGAIPFLIGKTRYLVNRRPVHADDSPFAAPIALGDVFFEGDLTRAQALNESIRFLTQIGAVALSPNIEVEYSDDEEALESSSADTDEWGIGIEIRNGDEEIPVLGSTVRKFYTNLLAHLLERGSDLSAIAPVYIGRVRYLLAEEPYHANGRRFQAIASKGGYFMEASLTHAQAVANALDLCEKLGLQAAPRASQGAGREGGEAVPLEMEIAGREIEGNNVPEFLDRAVTALYEEGLLTEADIPYKSGRVVYLIAATPRHEHGRDFRRPTQVQLGGTTYYLEANISRSGALEMMQRLLATKTANLDEPA